MQRNSNKCAHCGKALVGLTEKVPAISRSDGKTFHVVLYAGPDLSSGRIVCCFVYVHDQLGPDNQYVAVNIVLPSKDRRRILQAAEVAADKIATTVQIGSKLASGYILDDGRLLASGFQW